MGLCFLLGWSVELLVYIFRIRPWCLPRSAAVLVLCVAQVVLGLVQTWRWETRRLRTSSMCSRCTVTCVLLDWNR